MENTGSKKLFFVSLSLSSFIVALVVANYFLSYLPKIHKKEQETQRQGLQLQREQLTSQLRQKAIKECGELIDKLYADIDEKSMSDSPEELEKLSKFQEACVQDKVLDWRGY